MPPKKAPSSLASQKSLLPTTAAALSSSRPPLFAPVLPANDSLAPLWVPSSRPRELFPEWPSATALAAENWCTSEAPFEDSLIPNELLVPHEDPDSITWKRPPQFLPPIVEPTHTQSAPSAPVPAAPEPKAPAKKGVAAAVATPASKKGAAAEPEPAKKPPPKHAHVFYSDPHDPGHRVAATQAATPVAPVAGAVHTGAGHVAAGVSHSSHPHTNPAALSATAAAHPHSSVQHPVATDQHHHREEHHRIPRDFRRLWSADELEELAKWRLEEARIEREKEQRERVYMGFEDAIAYIVNERPRSFAQEEDVDTEDLVDDGEDEENGGEGSSSDAISNDSSPWGILPPARVEITPNAISKPEFPHGDIVHGDMASLFRIVEQLFDVWTSHETASSLSSSPPPTTEQLPPAFLWRAIYPQDANGVPIYNPGGKYSVKLFVFGKWRRVNIDDKLPVDAEGNIAYLTSSMKSEIWPALLTKALLKVVHWLGNGSNRSDKQEGDERDSGAIRMTNTVISALTGWKISQWQPDCQEIAGGESTLQQLLQYIPSTHAPDKSSEGNADTGELLESDGESSARHPASSAKPPAEMKPRAVICCGSERGSHVLHSGEAALVTDIIGDTENTMIKFTSLKGLSSVPEEMLAVDKLEFLLIHPPFKNRDLHQQHWTATKNEAIGAAAATAGGGDPTHALLWIPFANPTTQFAIVKMPKQLEEQAAGDTTSSEETADPTELHHHHHAHSVEAVFTLTRIPPADPLASTTDTRLCSSREVAKHLPAMDPRGSLILIEEMHVQSNQSSSPASKKPQAPMIITLNTLASTRVLLPFLSGGDGGEDRVFRVYPLSSLSYGYALQIESNEKVDFQEPSTYWRNVCDVQVVNSDGAYPVLLPNTWNILFKHNMELAAPPTATTIAAADDSEPDKHQEQEYVKLYVDLHLSDAMLGRYVHIAVVDDATGEVTKLSSLCSSVSLPVRDPAHPQPHAFTIIVDCAPQDFHVPEGKWHLTLGSNWLFKGSSSHAMKLTAFEGRYEANKPLLCFRDILSAPKKSIWTSFELQLLTNDTGGAGGDTIGGVDLSDNLAVKLEVIDSVSEQLLSECFAMKSVRLLQLPRRGGGDEPDDGGGYIIQGAIDRSRCVVPEELCSLRPFRNHVSSESTRQEEIKENSEEGAGGDSDEGVVDTQTSFPSARPRSAIKWRLNCWSAEDVKLDVDRTKENKFEAIRASWAEAVKDRNSVTNGAVSRLLFLGKMDAAEVKMKHDGVSDEQAKRLQARFEWLEAASAKMNDGVYREQRVRGNGGSDTHEERMKTVNDFQEEDRLLQEEIVVAQSQLAQKREDRLAAREQRAQEAKELVQSIREQRSAALKKRLKLWQQRDAILLA